MQVEFDLTIDDLIAFNRFFAEDQWKKIARAILIVTPILMPLMLIIGIPEKTWEFWLILLGFVFVFELMFWFLFCSFPAQIQINRSIDRITPKIVREAQTRGILDKHIITINEQGLVENFKENEYYWPWSKIERIDQNDTHIFIFIGLFIAHVIPKHVFADVEQAAEFFTTAKAFRARG